MVGRTLFINFQNLTHKSLLICIAFHYSPDREKYLIQVLLNLISNYKCPKTIIIDTNEGFDLNIYTGAHIVINIHPILEHPFHLTYMHRRHIKDSIDNYDVFYYLEDDILLPYENYLNYLENFKLLWPEYVPALVRIEEKEGEQYISDIPTRQYLNIIDFKGKQFAPIPFPINYNGFWIMPQKELKESMKEDFVKLNDGREFAASYVAWTLNKPTFLELEGRQISKKCYSYHLPNNYALTDGLPNGKIKVEDIFL